MATTLEIVRGIAQARANAYDGAHDERFVDGEDLAKKIGLRREEGCALNDSRVMDGFNVKMSGNMLTICYHTEYTSKEASRKTLESDTAQTIADIVKYLKKEYKKIVGESLSLTEPTEVDVRVDPISMRRVAVYAYQSFKLAGESEPVSAESEDRLDKAIKDFLSLGRDKAKKPKNYTAKNES
tara:strand:+ start:41 stop:589 length:549 start_codon:yes stop_codon:yes gene_type:complete